MLLTLIPLTMAVGRLASRQQPPSGPGRFLNEHVWNDTVDSFRDSPDPIERDSLLFGVNSVDNAPVLIPRAVVREHVHFLGAPGSGKTSMGLTPLITQLIRGGDCSVLILDLKGDDLALFETARIESGRAGLPFRYFTNRLGRSTHLFNPLRQSYLRDLEPSVKADCITEALGLQYGREYGKAYYTATNLDMLGSVLETFEGSHDLQSFRDVELAIHQNRAGLTGKLRDAASHARMMVNRMADLDALNATDRGEVPGDVLAMELDMIRLFQRPQVMHFHLTPLSGSYTAGQIGLMALHSLRMSSYASESGRRVPTYVFIDEFQRLAAPNLEVFLTAARSLDIHLILANQLMSDLKVSNAFDLSATVEACTRLRQHFTVSTEREVRDLVRSSGTTRLFQETFAEDERGTKQMFAEAEAPRLSPNELSLMSDSATTSALQVRRGEGFAQYGGFAFLVDGCHTYSKAEFNRREQAGWPRDVDGTVVSSVRRRRPGSGGQGRRRPVPPASPSGGGHPEQTEFGAGLDDPPRRPQPGDAAFDDPLAGFPEDPETDDD